MTAPTAAGLAEAEQDKPEADEAGAGSDRRSLHRLPTTLNDGDIFGCFEQENRNVAVYRISGDPFGDVRLAYEYEPGIELGRVVSLDAASPKLVTAMAGWSSATREYALSQVRYVWRWWELEVLQ